MVGRHLHALSSIYRFDEQGAARQGIDNGAGVVILPLQEGQPIWVFVVFHPAIRIAQRFTEVGVFHHFDARDGCRRHALRSGGSGQKPQRQQRERQRTGGAGECGGRDPLSCFPTPICLRHKLSVLTPRHVKFGNCELVSDRDQMLRYRGSAKFIG